MTNLTTLLKQVRACQICAAELQLGPRPILQANASARILIVGQAPGRKVHETGIMFNDASGERLRAWLGISREVFYDERQVAVVPMGFCYPGTGASGDLPPRSECPPAWRKPLLAHLQQIELTVVLGKYALAYHLPEYDSVTAAVQAWRAHWPHTLALPHPSPRNNLWLKKNPWFEADVLPQLRERVQQVLAAT